jgi:hypothetical protein
MAKSALERAAEAVAIACATATTFVKILDFENFTVSPDNLLELQFKEVGIDDDSKITIFRQALIKILPDKLMGDLQKMDLSPGVVIKLAMNHVEALILKHGV